MNYIENIYTCLAAPLLVAFFCARADRTRSSLICVFSGMTACLLSSYISTYLAAVYGIDHATTSVTISPLVEEIMKFLPVLFYLLVFEPKKEEIPGCVIVTATGFATFENVCYMIQNGSSDFFDLLLRGFGTGAMHIICSVIIFTGIVYLWEHLWLRAAGTFGLLVTSAAYHGIFNMMVMQPQASVVIAGCLIPLISGILFIIFVRYPGIR